MTSYPIDLRDLDLRPAHRSQMPVCAHAGCTQTAELRDVLCLPPRQDPRRAVRDELRALRAQDVVSVTGSMRGVRCYEGNGLLGFCLWCETLVPAFPNGKGGWKCMNHQEAGYSHPRTAGRRWTRTRKHICLSSSTVARRSAERARMW